MDTELLQRKIDPNTNPQSAPSRRWLFAAAAGALAVGASAALTPQRAEAATVVNTFLDQGGAVFNVKAYGAVGNGSTDDTAAIRSTISAAVSAGGGVVYFPQGTFLVTSTIKIVTQNIFLVGAGTTAAILRPGFVSGDVIWFNLPTGQNGGGVYQLSINSITARIGGAAIRLTSTSRIFLQDINMDSMFDGLTIDGAGGVLQFVDRGYWNNFSAGGTAIGINTTGNDQYISHIVTDSAVGNQMAAGLRLTASNGVWVTDCDFIHAVNGMVVDTPSGSRLSFVFVMNTAFDSCQSRCMLIDPAAGSTVLSLTFTGCWSATALTNDGAFVGPMAEGVQFIGHRFYNNATNGLLINGAKNVFVDNCTATGNNAIRSGGSGFAVTGNASRFAIRNCRTGTLGLFNWNQTNGIIVTSGCNEYIIANNLVGGNTTGILDGGGPNKSVTGNI